MSTLRQRFFAWMPRKRDDVCDRLYRNIKKELFSNIHGTVVEIGLGKGISIRYLPRNNEWIGVEPIEAFYDCILSAASKANTHSSIPKSIADSIRLPDESADIVISTLVLCSVPDQQKALEETKGF